MTSCNAPLMTNNIYNKCGNHLYTDGVYCNKVPSRFSDSHKIYFTIINQTDINCNVINMHEWGTLSIVDLWLWGNLNTCKNLYHQGYTDAMKNKNQISRLILDNNSSVNIYYEMLLNDYNKKEEEEKNKNKKMMM